MAYIKIFPIKVTDKKALDYITNPDKTDEKLLVSSFGCSPETADLEFSMTREMAKKNGMDKGDNLAFHLIQSFKPGEVDAETAHRLGQQFAAEVLKGKYEYVISTHVDKKHIHNHIIFNAASFVDHHKYVSNKRSYHKLCRISNRICHENGLATSMPTGEKGKSYKENMEYHRGTSWKAKLRVAVDKSIWTSINYEEFLQKMQLAGYEVRQGKHLSFRAPEQKNFTYMKSLGSYYSEENVRIRLAKNRSKVKTPRHLSREARLYINISTYVTTGNREGFEHWAKLNNLKEAARTFNYLSENNLLNYEDFRQHVSDVDASVKAADQRIAHITSELSTQKVIQKHCDSYRLCRKVIEDCKSAKNPKNEIKSSSLRDNNTGIIDSDWDLTQTDMVSFSTENLTLYYKIITNTEDYLVYKNRINELPEITQDTFNNNFLIIITSSSAYDLYNRDIYIDSIYADDNVTYINFAQNNPIDYTKSNNTWYAIVDNSQLRDTINIKINYTNIINNSNITQLADISTDYSIEKAIEDNCFVISNNIIISPNPSYLDEFLEHSNSENNFIRIYQKTNNFVEIFDIIYKDNFYFINRRLLSNTTIKKSVFKYIEKGNIHSNGLVRYYFTNTLSTETEYTEAFPFLSFYTK
mgnify:CR=1 FL=1